MPLVFHKWIKEDDALTSFDEVIPLMEEMERVLKEVKDEINVLENQEEKFDHVEVSLGDETKFRFHTSTLGLRQKEYKELGDEEYDKIPVYTAAAKPVIYFRDDLETYSEKILKASDTKKFVSVATDGDGTAGTNIVLHNRPFYINTSRLAIEVLDTNILPEYLFYSMRNIKKKFGFGYTIKCNKDNFIKYFTLRIPVDKAGAYSIEAQVCAIKEMKQKEKILDKILENNANMELLKKYAKFLAIEEEMN